MPNPITPLLTQLENPTELNLDSLLDSLCEAARSWDDLRLRSGLAEEELQRELKAMIELAGPIPACPDPHHAFKLHGEYLIRARRDAGKRYNDVFRIYPVRRQS